ncbi:MAG: GGDEF domain-containing protein [Lachnospiraceae bacterium]|nr:GGDEF domain-containing protein [Lachnospiraceae bacterium]
MKKERFVSLRLKMTIGVILICFLIGLLAILLVSRIATNIVDKEYGDKAEQIAKAMVSVVDPKDVSELNDAVMNVWSEVGAENVVPSSEWGSDEWNAYMANYEGIEDLPTFVKVRDLFREYQDIFNVDCIYVINYKTSLKQGIYVIDGAPDEDACPPGCVDSFEDGIWPDEENPVVPATITNEEVYGWLVTAGYPIVYEGKILGCMCVDISMNDIKDKERSYTISTAIAMIILALAMIILALLYVSVSIIRPVALLSNTAKNYCSENNDVVHHAFEKLQINTHDEIQELLSSMKQMESDMNSNITTLVDTKVALKETEDKANTLQALAVKDSLTGIRNKTAYDHEVGKIEADLADGFNEFGLAMVDLNFLKRTNDTYGHEKGNISIRRLCMLVCEIFEHSPVFRIGGDEFIVILKNRDYRNVDSLIDDFNKHLTDVQNDDTLEPWEKISAAIGYAKFDKKIDSTVDDVFKRADKAMYDRKVAMKAERKD